jgi:hypothetical protein
VADKSIATTDLRLAETGHSGAAAESSGQNISVVAEPQARRAITDRLIATSAVASLNAARNLRHSNQLLARSMQQLTTSRLANPKAAALENPQLLMLERFRRED